MTHHQGIVFLGEAINLLFIFKLILIEIFDSQYYNHRATCMPSA
jgi:hypothetical protein